MMWRTQYRAIMLFLLILIVGLGLYMDDSEIALILGSWLIVIFAVLKVVEFVMKLFGKVLFYDVKIIDNN